MSVWQQLSSAQRNIKIQATALLCICAAFIICAASPLHAQQAQPDSYAGFDGQPVSRVDIAAAPNVDIEKVRALIAQKAGQPFSEDAILQSVAALQQTHLFTEVQLTAEPDQSGLHLTFILQPADYVGLLEFPGVGTRLPYTALLQAANIPEQSAYVTGLEAQGEKGVVDYLHKQGYFAAEVTTELQRDEPHHIVNIVFHCMLGKQARVRSITFNGLTSQQSASTLAALHGLWARLKRVSLKTGQKYSEPRVTKSLPFIRDHLRTQGQLAPSIKLADPQYDADSNTVDLTLQVTPGPKTVVKVDGAKISRKTLQRLVPIYQENSVDQELVDEGETNLRSYFQTKGYFDATVDSQITMQYKEIDVDYTVDPGSKHRVKGIHFDGNEHFSDGQLKMRVTLKSGFLSFTRGSYSQQALNKSVASLIQIYHDAGYASVSIEGKVQDFEPQVFVTFEIKEGPRDSVASLHLEGNATQSLAALNRKYSLQMKVGQPFSSKLLDTDRSQLLAAYLDLGYLNANVRSAATPTKTDPHKMDVTFSIEEGPRAYISDVVLLGEKHTKERYIEHTSTGLVKKGQPQSAGNFLQTESNLYDLGVFDWASVRSLRPVVDQTQEEVLIKVHESPLNSMDIGGGLEIIPRDGNLPVNTVAVPGIPPISLGNKFTVSQKSYVGPRFTFDFVRHNLFGRAETATFGTVDSRLDQRAFFNYADPHFNSSSWSSLLSISAERTTENPIYTAELGSASLQFDKALNARRTSHFIARYSFQRTDLYDLLIPGLVLPQDQHVRLSGFDGEFTRDTRDKPLDAHHGSYQTFDFGVTSTALGASANFLHFLGQTAFYTPLRPWLTWANNFRLGLAAPISGSYVPLSERFFTGGADSLRGFPINGAGPQRPLAVCSNPTDSSTCTLISVPLGGDMLFIVNSEARFPLPIKQGLGGVFFYDGGNVYSNIRLNEFTGNFTHSVGFGLRYDTPVGPVRVDLGYRITDIPGVKNTQYFVTLGQSF